MDALQCFMKSNKGELLNRYLDNADMSKCEMHILIEQSINRFKLKQKFNKIRQVERRMINCEQFKDCSRLQH